MSWDIVLFHSKEKIHSVEQLNPDALEDTDFARVLEQAFDRIIKDGKHREIIGEDFSIEFFVSERPLSNTMLNLYGENALFALIELAKKHNWQIYDGALDEMIDLEHPEKNGYHKHRKYVKQIMENTFTLESYIQQIQTHLIQTHAKVLDCFRKDPELRNYRPKDGGWTISEILEHIALTSHFLLILIDKGADKALRNIQNQSLEKLRQEFHYDLSRLNEIGIHKSFAWIRPEHMEPTGQKTDMEIRDQLISQLNRCLNHLQALKKGEGLLYKTTMSVNELGKINVYEYIYFLSKHAERHLQQIAENENQRNSTFNNDK